MDKIYNYPIVSRYAWQSLCMLLFGILLSPVLIAETPQLSLPKYRLQPYELAVIVNDKDPLSVQIGNYYLQARGLPAGNLLHINFEPKKTTIQVAAFTRLRNSLLKTTPEHIQAYAITWSTPYRVGCMSITSAITFGLESGWCSQQQCDATRHSPYYNYKGADPYVDLAIRPTISIAANNFAAAKRLIDSGIAADNTLPQGTAYLVSTSDSARNVRAYDYPRINTLMQGWFETQIIHDDALRNRDDVLFYFTGKSKVDALDSLTFLPGAIADHLTSAGGQLNGSKQMSALRWLEAGASGSYGTVVEPCNHPGKFPNPAILMEHYSSGSTLIEAYWKSVQQPGEGIFIGEPLAAPFDQVAIEQTDQQTRLITRNIKPGLYQLTHAVSPVGPFRKLTNILVKYHQKQLILPKLKNGYYQLKRSK
ncbi:MAG: TIGR03790 family protein [Candidatus Thiodiazotropha sp. (ex Lucinoma borealis)]|nr:TIGR03790 family protein [Candidatus Thiodiazotropha sp. (ex Lucinoma borealis)]